MTIETFEYTLPAHWVCPLEYGADSCDGMSEEEILQFELFQDDVASKIGNCFPVSYGDETDDFRRYHDATAYGVLACNCVTVTFMN